jgi:hypothetical protein
VQRACSSEDLTTGRTVELLPEELFVAIATIAMQLCPAHQLTSLFTGYTEEEKQSQLGMVRKPIALDHCSTLGVWNFYTPGGPPFIVDAWVAVPNQLPGIVYSSKPDGQLDSHKAVLLSDCSCVTSMAVRPLGMTHRLPEGFLCGLTECHALEITCSHQITS